MQYTLQQLLFTVALAATSLSAYSQPFAYVPNEKDGTVSVIDTTTDEVVKRLPAKGKLGKKKFRQRPYIPAIKTCMS